MRSRRAWTSSNRARESDMAALSPAIRSGPVLAVVVALVLATPAGGGGGRGLPAARGLPPPAGAGGAGTPPHTTTPGGGRRPGARPPAGGVLQMQSHVSRQTSNIVEQSGGNFVMNAKVAQQPLG